MCRKESNKAAIAVNLIDWPYWCSLVNKHIHVLTSSYKRYKQENSSPKKNYDFVIDKRNIQLESWKVFRMVSSQVLALYASVVVELCGPETVSQAYFLNVNWSVYWIHLSCT